MSVIFFSFIVFVVGGFLPGGVYPVYDDLFTEFIKIVFGNHAVTSSSPYFLTRASNYPLVNFAQRP